MFFLGQALQASKQKPHTFTKSQLGSGPAWAHLSTDFCGNEDVQRYIGNVNFTLHGDTLKRKCEEMFQIYQVYTYLVYCHTVRAYVSQLPRRPPLYASCVRYFTC